MNKNRIGIVTGISGCGKDFLLERSRQSGHLLDAPQVIPFGEAVSMRLKRASVTLAQGNRDSLRELPLDLISQHAKALLDEVITHQPTILNSHTVYRQGDNLVVSPESERKLNPSHYLFITADPEDIIKWRVTDMSRLRPSESVQEIELHQAIALSVVKTIAETMDSRLLVVHNTVATIATNTQRIGEFLSTI